MEKHCSFWAVLLHFSNIWHLCELLYNVEVFCDSLCNSNKNGVNLT